LLSFDASALRAVCSLHDATEGVCPRAAMVGTASARTSLLDKPLSGGVYIVQPEGTGQPDLWTILSGNSVRFNVRGRLRVENHRTHARLLGLPDMPLSRFVMRFEGGEQGVISLASNPCARSAGGANMAKVILEGQDRAVRIAHTTLNRPACGE